MTSFTCQLGWHVVRDFLRLWSPDGSGSMLVRFNGRLRDRHATCVYQVASKPDEAKARRACGATSPQLITGWPLGPLRGTDRPIGRRCR